MSFDSVETSTYGGAPYQLLLFTMGATKYPITSGDTEQTYNSDTYIPEAIDVDEIDLSRETTAGSINVSLPAASDLAQLFIAFTPPQPVWLTIYEGHHGDAEVVVRFQGCVQQAKFDGKCILRCSPLTMALRKRIPGPTYQQACNRIHYSPACGANAGANSWAFKVGTIAADGVTIDVNQAAGESAAFIAYWGPNWASASSTPNLSWGYVEMSSGHKMMTMDHPSAYRIVLKAHIPGLAAGDVVTVYRGCRRSIAHCNFYGRTNRFLGFDLMPSKNPFILGMT